MFNRQGFRVTPALSRNDGPGIISTGRQPDPNYQNIWEGLIEPFQAWCWSNIWSAWLRCRCGRPAGNLWPAHTPFYQRPGGVVPLTCPVSLQTDFFPLAVLASPADKGLSLHRRRSEYLPGRIARCLIEAAITGFLSHPPVLQNWIMQFSKIFRRFIVYIFKNHWNSPWMASFHTKSTSDTSVLPYRNCRIA